MTTTLITGANKGLGRELARRLVAEGHDVWLGARDAAAGRKAADEVGGRFVALDVLDDASVAAAVRTVGDAGGLDRLVNNAGINAGATPPLETDLAAMEHVFATNVVGAVRVTLAFVPLLERSDDPVVVNVSSGLGSLARSLEPTGQVAEYAPIAYPASKAALNLATVKLARALPRMRVLAATPGYTATDLNDFAGTEPVEEGVEGMVRAALTGPEDGTCRFLEAAGDVPW